MKKLWVIMVALLVIAMHGNVGAQVKKEVKSTKPTAGTAKKLPEEEKINRLIKYIAGLEGATFIRNGDEYSAKAAAEHLQMKRKKAGTRVETARQFIDGLASESYLSGKAYQIRMKDGKTYSSREVLLKELERIERIK